MERTFELDTLESMSALSDIHRILRIIEVDNANLRRKNGELIAQHERSVDDRVDLTEKVKRLEETISESRGTEPTDIPIESDLEALFRDAQNHIKLTLERIDSLSESNIVYGFGRELALAKTKLEEADLWLSGKAKNKYKLCVSAIDTERN